jgi:hypothetical protein
MEKFMNDAAIAELNQRLVERTQAFLKREVEMLDQLRVLRRVLRQCRDALAASYDVSELPVDEYSEQARALAAAEVELKAFDP